MRPVLAVLLVVLLCPAVQGAWRSTQHDAAQSGVADGPGPAWDDVAYTVQLGAAPSFYAQPILLDGWAYILLSPELTGADAPHGKAGIVRVALRTAHVESFAALQGVPRDFAMVDGDFVVVGDGGAQRVDGAGVVLWSWNAPPVRADSQRTICFRVLAVDPILVGCNDEGVKSTPPPSSPGDGVLPYVAARASTASLAALDAKTGTLVWQAALTPPGPPDDPLAAAGQGAPPAANTDLFFLGLFGTTLVACALEISPVVRTSTDPATGLPVAPSQVMRDLVAGFDAASGRLLWTQAGAWTDRASPYDETQPRLPPAAISGPVGDANVVYVKLDLNALAINARSGAILWSQPVRAADAVEDYGGTTPVLDGQASLIPAASSVTQFDTLTQEVRWRYALPPDRGLVWSVGDSFAAGDQILMVASRDSANPPDRVTVVSLDAETGQERWLHEFPAAGGIRAAVDGHHMAVIDFVTGNLTVFGATDLSPIVHAAADAVPPQPGEPMRIDLSGSSGGSAGPATSFRVLWGDGTISDWQSDATFEHAYAAVGPVTARFMVRNDAGQTASTTMQFDVGAPRLNALQRAFSPENQNVTFFVIGLVVTGTGALLGLLRLRRRQSILQKELRAINDAYERSRGRVDDCERMLHERKAHVAALLQEGRVDEAKYAVLERRIEELLRAVRTGVLDARFDFLPRGLARRLEALLADGQISPWEREAFEVLLRDEKLLTAAQKAQVRAMVARWAASDAA